MHKDDMRRSSFGNSWRGARSQAPTPTPHCPHCLSQKMTNFQEQPMPRNREILLTADCDNDRCAMKGGTFTYGRKPMPLDMMTDVERTVAAMNKQRMIDERNEAEDNQAARQHPEQL